MGRYPGRKYERKEDQKQDFFLGLFSSRAQRKKNAYIKKKKCTKNRKIVKNLLMYDKKNFLPPPPHKKSPKKQNRPKQQSKKRKRMKKNPKQPEKNSEASLFDFQNGKEKKRIKTKIKSQDYETFFVSPNILFHILHIKNLCPTLRKNEHFEQKILRKKA